MRQAGGTTQVLRALGKTSKTQHFNISDKDDSPIDDFQDVISDGISSIEDKKEQK